MGLLLLLKMLEAWILLAIVEAVFNFAEKSLKLLSYLWQSGHRNRKREVYVPRSEEKQAKSERSRCQPGHRNRKREVYALRSADK